MKTTLNTGTLELRALSQRYVTEALLLAGLLHFAMIGGYQIYAKLTEDTTEIPVRIKRVLIDVLPPPPSFNPSTVLPKPTLSVFEKPSVGMPIPIPDPEFNLEKTIATQPEMNEIFNTATTTEQGGTTEYIFPGTEIENNDAPVEFHKVEIEPKVAYSVYPPYPEIARKAEIEGIVFVKMLLSKEGKVKKTEIAKSTNDLFNEVSLEAAKQWVFTPAIMNNGPVSVWVTIPFKFKLNNRY